MRLCVLSCFLDCAAANVAADMLLETSNSTLWSCPCACCHCSSVPQVVCPWVTDSHSDMSTCAGATEGSAGCQEPYTLVKPKLQKLSPTAVSCIPIQACAGRALIPGESSQQLPTARCGCSAGRCHVSMPCSRATALGRPPWVDRSSAGRACPAQARALLTRSNSALPLCRSACSPVAPGLELAAGRLCSR